VHIVLIPGFGGFDALGNLEYYSGVTQLFRHLFSASDRVVLHYFDNLPTAAVVTRAARLRNYLAKRIARGEILHGDDLVLVGHSTGGLDIRQLVWDLARHREQDVLVDGGVKVRRKQILALLRRVVFLSVPHWGTNIADWVHSHNWLRKAVVEYLRAALAGSQVYLLDEVEQALTGGAACMTGADILLAVQDCLTEANERYGKRGPQRTAAAHEAAADLGLYLRDMASDFHVIDDLTARRPAGDPRSPAHFNNKEREEELQIWRDRRINVLSYATVGHRPFSFQDTQLPTWSACNPLAYPEVFGDGGPANGTDIAYRLCYRACCGGPFQGPNKPRRDTRVLGPRPPQPLKLWDNDGIVNTASMLWPDGEIVLVLADHLNIVGHYHLEKATPGGEGRKYQSYDSLKSASHFSPTTFAKVWREIFAFCTSPRVAAANAGS
jgi:hypothetical protein